MKGKSLINGYYDILLFEENIADIVLLRECFHQLNFKHTITVLKSEQSLDEMISVEKSFDCIISEIRVLDLTAHVILTKIKNSKLSTIPFIILTSDHYPEHLKACAELGADLVLNKPLDYFQYLEKAKSIMERITEDKSTYIYRNENPCV